MNLQNTREGALRALTHASAWEMPSTDRLDALLARRSDARSTELARSRSQPFTDDDRAAFGVGSDRPAATESREMVWFVRRWESDRYSNTSVRTAAHGLGPAWPHLYEYLRSADGSGAIPAFFTRDETVAFWPAPDALPSEPVRDELFGDWAYASAWCGADLWDRERMAGAPDDTFGGSNGSFPPPQSLIRIRKALPSLRGTTSNWGLGEWIRFAWERDQPAIAFALHRHYRPVGQCSMDTTPTATTIDYLRAAMALGRASEVVSLYLRSMDYGGSSRVAWTSWGAAVQPRVTGVIAQLPVDPMRLLRGLVVDVAGVPGGHPGCSVPTLTAIARETDCLDAFTAWLGDVATDGRADLANRLRALEVLVGLRAPETPAVDELLATLSPLPEPFLAMRDGFFRPRPA